MVDVLIHVCVYLCVLQSLPTPPKEQPVRKKKSLLSRPKSKFASLDKIKSDTESSSDESGGDVSTNTTRIGLLGKRPGVSSLNALQDSSDDDSSGVDTGFPLSSGLSDLFGKRTSPSTSSPPTCPPTAAAPPDITSALPFGFDPPPLLAATTKQVDTGKEEYDSKLSHTSGRGDDGGSKRREKRLRADLKDARRHAKHLVQRMA